MTTQARSFGWSIGIHGTIVLAVFLLQLYAGSEARVAVIDFTLGDTVTAAPEQAPPELARETEPKTDKPVPRPKAEIARRKAPRPDAQKIEPEQVSLNGKEAAPPLPASVEETRPAAPAEERTAVHDAGGERKTGSATAARASYLKEHFAYIRDKITKNIAYPALARTRGWFGRVKIAFIVREDGGVDQVRVVESSGFDVLDLNIVDTVRKVAPFPSPPIRAEIRMAITYRLD